MRQQPTIVTVFRIEASATLLPSLSIARKASRHQGMRLAPPAFRGSPALDTDQPHQPIQAQGIAIVHIGDDGMLIDTIGNTIGVQGGGGQGRQIAATNQERKGRASGAPFISLRQLTRARAYFCLNLSTRPAV